MYSWSKVYFLPLAFCGLSLQSAAQITTQADLIRVSEAEIQLQDKYMEAMVQLQIGKKEAAAKLFQEILQKKTTCDACAFQLSRIYTAQDNLLLAVEMAQKAAQLDPENVWYQWAWAEALERNGRDKEAIEIYKKMAETADLDTAEELAYRLVVCYARLAEPNKALKVLDELERKIGLQVAIVEKKTTLYEALGAETKAAQEWRKLAESQPNNIEYQRFAANYYTKIKDKTAAKLFYNRILALNPNDSQALLAAVEQKKATGDVAFLQGLEANFANPNLNIDEKIKVFLPYVDKIAATRATDLAQQGLVLAQILDKTHPNEVKALALLGDLQYQNNQIRAALQTYRRCNALNKRVFAVWEQQMRLEFELGLFTDLAQTAEQAVDLFPSQAVAFFFWGLANDKKGDWVAAADALEQAVLMSAKKIALKQDITAALIGVYAKQRETAKADALFKEANTADVRPLVQLRYAQALILRGEPAAARDWLDKALLQVATSKEGLLLEIVGDVFFGLKDTNKAVEYWQKARDMGNISQVLEKKIAEKNFFEL